MKTGNLSLTEGPERTVCMWALASSFEGVFSPEADGKAISIPSSRGDQSWLVRAVVVMLFLLPVVLSCLIGEIAATVVGKASAADAGSINDRTALT